MAKIALGLATSHSPMLCVPAEEWVASYGAKDRHDPSLGDYPELERRNTARLASHEHEHEARTRIPQPDYGDSPHHDHDHVFYPSSLILYPSLPPVASRLMPIWLNVRNHWNGWTRLGEFQRFERTPD